MSTDDKIKRKIQFTLSDDMAQSVAQYMEVHGIESPTQAIKSLVTEAVAVTPKSGAVIAACRRAFLSVQQMLLESTGRFYSDMGRQVNLAIADISSQRVQCPHCGNDL